MKKTTMRLVIITLLISMITPAKAKTKADEIIDNMSLRQKITQTFMMDFTSWNGQSLTSMNDEFKKVLEDYDFGGIILFANNIKDTKETFELVQGMQEAAMKDDGIPLLISTDQEGGTVYRLGSGTSLPGNMAIGATNDPVYAKMAGNIIGSELESLGINTTLAPVADINNNANNPVIGLRSYSDSSDMVGEYVSEFIKGLDEYHIIGCAKHFPGHGNTSIDSHYGLPCVDRSLEELKDIELQPFQKAINEGIDMIMSAHILYSSLDDTTILSNKTGKQEHRPATLSYKIITELLKEQMHFDGVVCSDAMNMSGISNTFDECQATVEALAAGIDMICMPASGISNLSGMARVDRIIQAVEKAIDEKYLSEDRIDDACRRILTLKEDKGVLDLDLSTYSLQHALEIVGGKENKALEESISTKAVTVIENKNNLLPLNLNENSRVLFLYPYEYQKNKMLAGWEKAKSSGLIPEGAEVMTYQYYRTNYAIMGTLKNALDWADTIIVNSEVSSDNSMLYTTWTAAGPNTIVNYCHETGKKAIVMSIDKPYDVQLYKNADAIIAVYGSSINITAGIEVILGIQGASGKLPLDIPLFDNGLGLYTKDLVYKKGDGISYSGLLAPDTPKINEIKIINDKVHLEWQDEECDEYRLYRNDELIYKGKQLFFDDLPDMNGKEYTYQIVASNEKGESSPVSQTIYYIIPPTFNTQNQFFSKVKVYIDKLDGVDGYEIVYSHGSSTTTYNLTKDQKSTYTTTKLERNQDYTFKVRSYKVEEDKMYYSEYNIIENVVPHTFIWF